MRSAYERTVALDVQAIQEYTAGIEAARDEYAAHPTTTCGAGVDRCADCGRRKFTKTDLCRKCRGES